MSMTAAVDGLISLKVRNTGRVFYFLMSLHPLSQTPWKALNVGRQTLSGSHTYNNLYLLTGICTNPHKGSVQRITQRNALGSAALKRRLSEREPQHTAYTPQPPPRLAPVPSSGQERSSSPCWPQGTVADTTNHTPQHSLC